MLTRTMLNLIGLKRGQTVCDPFCGTETTLLEAESMGIGGIGLDFNVEMCKIARDNIGANGYASRVMHGDFRILAEIADEFHGVVTDLPYGRNSKTAEDPRNLLRDLLSIIPRGKRFAVMFKKELAKGLELEPEPELLKLKRYEIYRHKSLTRTVLIK